jgi:ArsR family transcriptional regulator
LASLIYIYEYMSSRSYKPKRRPPSERNIEQLAELFGALADASRLRIIKVLMDDEKNVRAIAEEVALSESAVSHQLRGLRQMRLVRSRKAGREVFYALDDEHVADLFRRGLEHVKHG